MQILISNEAILTAEYAWYTHLVHWHQASDSMYVDLHTVKKTWTNMYLSTIDNCPYSSDFNDKTQHFALRALSGVNLILYKLGHSFVLEIHPGQTSWSLSSPCVLSLRLEIAKNNPPLNTDSGWHLLLTIRKRTNCVYMWTNSLTPMYL